MSKLSVDSRVHNGWLSDDNKPDSSPPQTGNPTNGITYSELVGKRIIIVEDEGVTQMQLQRTLRKAGLIVVGSATNAEDGVALALHERPEIVLMDIRMPGPYDGIEATKRILAEYSVCIIILTAFSDEAYRQKSRDHYVCDYILKPVNVDILLPRIAAAWRNFRSD